MIKNKESGKHLAQTLRIIGVSQFIHYGVVNLDTAFSSKQSFITLCLSATMFLVMEYAGIKAINKGDKK